jgi:hypothetical protein
MKLEKITLEQIAKMFKHQNCLAKAAKLKHGQVQNSLRVGAFFVDETLCLKSKTQLPPKLVEALKEIAEWDEQTLKTETFENEHYIIKLENRLIVSVEEK